MGKKRADVGEMRKMPGKNSEEVQFLEKDEASGSRNTPLQAVDIFVDFNTSE